MANSEKQGARSTRAGKNTPGPRTRKANDSSLSDEGQDGEREINVEQIIKDAIDKAAERMKAEFTAVIEEKFSKLESQILDRIDALEKYKDDAEKTVQNLRDEIMEMKTQISRNLHNAREAWKTANHVAQYTRRSNVRVFGIPEEDGENCKLRICELINSKLQAGIVTMEDIGAAHRVPSKKSKEEGTPQPIIVRFTDREKKTEVLKLRKKLKGQKIGINEDVTVDNMKLINRAHESNMFESVWFANGKVKGKTTNGRTVTLDLFQNFAD